MSVLLLVVSVMISAFARTVLTQRLMQIKLELRGEVFEIGILKLSNPKFYIQVLIVSSHSNRVEGLRLLWRANHHHQIRMKI